MSILEAGSPYLLEADSPCLFLKQAVHVYCTLEAGSPWPLNFNSPCPCFEKKAVFIYIGGSEPCPFWRQAVHVHVLKKRQSLSILEAGSNVHSGGRQSMSMF